MLYHNNNNNKSISTAQNNLSSVALMAFQIFLLSSGKSLQRNGHRVNVSWQLLYRCFSSTVRIKNITFNENWCMTLTTLKIDWN